MRESWSFVTSGGPAGRERAKINDRSFAARRERTRRQLQLKYGATRLVRVCHEIRLDRRHCLRRRSQCRHSQGAVDRAKAAAFDNGMFGGPFSQKSYACFVRRYDASRPAQHPNQKVSAMKLLVTAEDALEDMTINYSFRLGSKHRHRAGDFDSSGSWNHIVAENAGGEIRLGCGVDCEGGGTEVAMKDDKSALIRLERIKIWERNKADDDASNDLVAGADDKIFHVDRADLR
ncbi:hypothetical protein [Bradyrhizobium archetypum]|uniref:Uncharacterized protein n=1 Tax=Bradyrhizobium archetypum TaxID=2721160 RepID=A0A7Y4HA76_9BRAD|nr:hypothetical protein [Bradyrhizobium archetypum]NOJ49972.1 hypothetical protein [Bradyrhizobium archetypum]